MAKKKKKKAKKKNAIKVILSTDEETAADEEDIDNEEDESGMYLEKDDVLLIYKALKNYQPGTEDKEMTYELLVEQFEEILIVDYKLKIDTLWAQHL